MPSSREVSWKITLHNCIIHSQISIFIIIKISMWEATWGQWREWRECRGLTTWGVHGVSADHIIWYGTLEAGPGARWSLGLPQCLKSMTHVTCTWRVWWHTSDVHVMFMKTHMRHHVTCTLTQMRRDVYNDIHVAWRVSWHTCDVKWPVWGHAFHVT